MKNTIKSAWPGGAANLRPNVKEEKMTHWIVYAEYGDGSSFEKTFPYNEKNYRSEQERQNELEEYLISRHPDCIFYSVGVVDD